MATIRDIRRRIRSARSIQQITRAMKFVSAARLRKAQERVIAARPYARQMMAVIESLVARVGGGTHPLLEHREGRKIELVVITADRGLCGAYNTNILRRSLEFILEHEGDSVALNLLGKKARDFFRRRPYAVRKEAPAALQSPSFANAAAIAGSLVEDFTSGKIDQVWMVYNEFKSVVHQRVVVERLLPIERPAHAESVPAVEYLYDEPPARLLDHLLHRHVEAQVYRAVLEAAASEQGARMTAMEAATNNAAEMIESLTLYANKVRQAGITKEIIEVVSGAGGTGA
ncbi:MAG: ATP synthase F1 subunit gamma [Acidobacteria bacterium]|nr:ATP synthase F1 subunit gamma [Acidobacteriota bacterium]